MMLRVFAAISLLALTGVACGDESSTEPETPITTTGGFELAVERGTQAEWTHRVTLPAGTWTSAGITSCEEMRGITVVVGPCESATIRLEAGVMTFSGTVGGEYTDKIRVRWEARGR